MSIVVVSIGSVAQGGLAEGLWQTERLSCVKKGSFDVGRWEIAGLHLERSTLSDVERSLGPASRFRIGPDAVSAESLCYSVDGEQIAVFESGPLGGPEGLLLALSIADRSGVPFAAQCVHPTRDLTSEISRGRSVGAVRADVEQVAGAEYCYRDASTTEWNFKQERDAQTTLSGLHASFDHDRLRGWRAYSVTSR